MSPLEIIAHRGASDDAPENTLAAVLLGWEQKADAVEIDVQFTKDGKIVVFHDGALVKRGGVRKKIKAHTLAELRRLDVGRWKDEKWSGEGIPTLTEVLATVPDGKRLFIEIKCGRESLPEFEQCLRRSGKRPEQIVVIGFALEKMKLFKRRLPDIEVCWISKFKKHWQNGGWSPRPATLIQKATAAGLDGLDLGVSGLMTSDQVRQIKAAGLKLYVWTVDSAAQATGLIDAGVDGITTNRPGWLRARLAKPPRFETGWLPFPRTPP